MKALSVTALILSIISIFIPFGYFLSAIAALFALGGLMGGLSISISALLVNLVNIAFLSPTLLFTVLANDKNNKSDFLFNFLVVEQFTILFIIVIGSIMMSKNK